jgi:hypothetical protein
MVSFFVITAVFSLFEALGLSRASRKRTCQCIEALGLVLGIGLLLPTTSYLKFLVLLLWKNGSYLTFLVLILWQNGCRVGLLFEIEFLVLRLSVLESEKKPLRLLFGVGLQIERKQYGNIIIIIVIIIIIIKFIYYYRFFPIRSPRVF